MDFSFNLSTIIFILCLTASLFVVVDVVVVVVVVQEEMQRFTPLPASRLGMRSVAVELYGVVHERQK